MPLTDRATLRLIVAVILAPAVVPALVAVPSLLPAFSGLWVIAVLVASVTYSVAWVAGLPVLLLLRAFGVLTWWSLTLCGAILGLLPSLVLAFANQYHALMGAVTGLAFWCIAFAGAKPNPPRGDATARSGTGSPP
jgi:hypothetical protein